MWDAGATGYLIAFTDDVPTVALVVNEATPRDALGKGIKGCLVKRHLTAAHRNRPAMRDAGFDNSEYGRHHAQRTGGLEATCTRNFQQGHSLPIRQQRTYSQVPCNIHNGQAGRSQPDRSSGNRHISEPDSSLAITLLRVSNNTHSSRLSPSHSHYGTPHPLGLDL